MTDTKAHFFLSVMPVKYKTSKCDIIKMNLKEPDSFSLNEELNPYEETLTCFNNLAIFLWLIMKLLTKCSNFKNCYITL